MAIGRDEEGCVQQRQQATNIDHREIGTVTATYRSCFLLNISLVARWYM